MQQAVQHDTSLAAGALQHVCRHKFNCTWLTAKVGGACVAIGDQGWLTAASAFLAIDMSAVLGTATKKTICVWSVWNVCAYYIQILWRNTCIVDIRAKTWMYISILTTRFGCVRCCKSWDKRSIWSSVSSIYIKPATWSWLEVSKHLGIKAQTNDTTSAWRTKLRRHHNYSKCIASSARTCSHGPCAAYGRRSSHSVPSTAGVTSVIAMSFCVLLYVKCRPCRKRPLST